MQDWFVGTFGEDYVFEIPDWAVVEHAIEYRTSVFAYNTGNSDNASNKPGPDPNPNSTRNRRQVPMYLPNGKADSLNSLSEQLDGRSKVAGEGGIEKHADFMEALVDFAIENEDELAARLGIKKD
jgi:hypothetical protein